MGILMQSLGIEDRSGCPPRSLDVHIMPIGAGMSSLSAVAFCESSSAA